mmetsp:Transcript_36020/g.106499  ORF Transcript_36020/g.106499 Transcript_36020/m.106499 type:complete len:96 (+) Transcript_36020:3-290(+)
MRPDWPTAKLAVMAAALRAKFRGHASPRRLLLSSAPLELVESSPHDFFWGQGYDGSGANHLGRILMMVRSELLAGGEHEDEDADGDGGGGVGGAQ